MFYLSLMEHTLLLPPHLLNRPLQDGIKEELQNIFLDKVIANLGLCISIYDIRKIDGGFIYPAEGASTYTVEFRMVVFRPFVGEVIVADLKESNEDVSLGFFDDIYIPEHELPIPHSHSPDPYNRNKVIWTWEFVQEEGNPPTILTIDGTDVIKFRVVNVKYPPIPIEQTEKPFAPMVVTGTLNFDGLGPVSWWW
ncbi:hypothetical protein Tsubulata_014182 [Turnera subulata]|uniref:DNA-directed RNA polymerase subunit n=1 Tax=Turnera subulata TaxID=218843 RepID=A0A9Q0FFY0_9ROSI|nr:hypothetical protein Tsubulata_014182 [Turnera subulata]